MVFLACVASVSNRVIVRKLERDQKKKKVEGGGAGEKRKRLPASPMILENAPWYFTVRFICKLTARQNRSTGITKRLLCSLIEHIPGNCKNCNKKVYDKEGWNSERLLRNFLILIVWLYLVWNLVETSKMICPEQFSLNRSCRHS